MTTERLAVLAGAAALGEFTASELAAYTGANANTVRQVLQREQKRHGFFNRVEAARKPPNGRPALLWRLSEEHRAEILSEIAHEEAQLAELHGAVDDRLAARAAFAQRVDRASMFVSSAEEMVARSYDPAYREERKAYAAIALNLLRAGDPSVAQHVVNDTTSSAEWWERESEKLRSGFIASLDTISRVSIESQLRSVQHSGIPLKDEEVLRRRAHRVAAFAALSAHQAEGLPIGPEDLADAAESISAGSGVLPVAQTLGWIKVFVDASIASGNPAPVALLAKSQQSPENLFSATRGVWSRVPPPAELADSGYSLWVESWAKTLLTYSLIPGIVVAHDDSPESNATLTQVMGEAEGSWLRRTVVVASTTSDSQVVARRVALSGGIFYPIQQTAEGLLATVNRAIANAVSATPDLSISYWIASGIYQSEPDRHYSGASALDILRAVSGVVMPPAELEVARRTLAIVDDAVKEFDIELEAGSAPAGQEQSVAYEDLVRRLVERFSDLGGSRRALSVTEEALSSCLRILSFKYPSLRLLRGRLAHGWLLEIEQRREGVENMAWAYEKLAALAKETDTDEVSSEVGDDQS